LALLDEGVVTDAFNKKISCQNLFVIATSNAGAEYTRELVNGGIKGETLQKAVVDYIQKQGFFSPEFLNRFDGVVVFEPLKKEDLTKIARLQLEELKSELEKKNIYLEIDEGTCAKLAEDGYDPPFGARPMRRIIELVLGDLLGKAILKGEIQMGDRIKILPGAGKEEYKWEKISN
jgi:ATP-dependent Clp protease ATP-binding subunit ClpB